MFGWQCTAGHDGAGAQACRSRGESRLHRMNTPMSRRPAQAPRLGRGKIVMLAFQNATIQTGRRYLIQPPAFLSLISHRLALAGSWQYGCNAGDASAGSTRRN
jgi:hypothetical protein